MAENPSILAFAFVVVALLVAGGAAGAYLYVHSRSPPGPSPFAAREGDNVTVNYVGIFGSGPDEGKVFDTSLYSVSTNDAAYPKSIQFHPRGAPGNYTPLAVHVGAGTPSGGYSIANHSFIQVVTGFWQGLVGLPGNVTRLVVVPPALGYGNPVAACFKSLPLVVTIPIVLTESGTAFTSQYPGVLATTGASFLDPTYGFQVLILSANTTSVTIENFAYVGETTMKPGWPVEVTSVSSTPNGSGAITLRNMLLPSDVGRIAGHVANGPCSSSSNGNFILSAVNFTRGTYTENFNQEVQGNVLIFEVTIVNIYRPVGTGAY